MSAGTVIELENPTQDALTGTGDQQTWAGSDATLYQTLLHEIGHALGLADNADPNSVMNYDLTSSNQQLDSTDVQAIQALYGSPSASAASSAQVEALIQAMAGYATSGSAQTTTTPTTDSADQALELAAAGH